MPQFTINFCSCISLLNVFFFHPILLTFFVYLGGPALCLNFGPSSELGVNEGVSPAFGLFPLFFIYQISPFSL